MHTSVRDVVGTADDAKKYSVPIGTHLITALIEGDGAVELASSKATITARVIGSPTRTSSGGIEVKVAVLVSEPVPAPILVPEPVHVPTPEEDAAAYFVGLGMTQKDAEGQVERFGAARVLAMRDKKLDEELANLVEPAQPR